MARYRPSMFKGAASRDENEPLFIELLQRYRVEYSKGAPGDGYDLLVQIHPMELWEIKNPSRPASGRKLTEAERTKQAYCKAAGIPYRILEYTDQAVDILAAFFRKLKGQANER